MMEFGALRNSPWANSFTALRVRVLPVPDPSSGVVLVLGKHSAIRNPHSICFGSLSRFAGGPMANPPKLFLPELRATLALAIPMMIGQYGQMLMGITDTLVLGR